MEETGSILRLTKWQMLVAKETMVEEKVWRVECILRSQIAIVDQKKYEVGCCFWFGVFFKYLC